MKRHFHQGYIAIVFTLFVTLTSVVFATALANHGVHRLANVRTIDASMRAKQYANACAETALANVASTVLGSGSGSLTFSDGSCTYTLTSPLLATRTIVSTGVSGTATRKVQVGVTLTTILSITEWREIQ